MSCSENTSNELHTIENKLKSDFDVSGDYRDFSQKMKVGDTIFIDVNLSLHGYEEYDRLRITKTNQKIRLKVIELKMYNLEPETIEFPEVDYDLYGDTLSLENIFTVIDNAYSSEMTTPFFTIYSPDKKDTIRLTTKSASQKQMLRDQFFSIYDILYSQQRDELCEKYFTACWPFPTPMLSD